jgi:hypothetical protein
MIEAPVGSDLQFNYATVSGEGRLLGQTLPWERVRISRVKARTMATCSLTSSLVWCRGPLPADKWIDKYRSWPPHKGLS